MKQTLGIRCEIIAGDEGLCVSLCVVCLRGSLQSANLAASELRETSSDELMNASRAPDDSLQIRLKR
jgi:hypothetical protein